VASEAHELALLLAGRCRACAERLPGGAALRGRPCPACGTPTAPTQADRVELARRFGERAGARMWGAILAVAVATLLTGWAPLLASLVLAAGLVWVGTAIVRPALRLLPAGRRVVAGWTLRLVGAAYLAVLVVFVELLTLLPGVGVPVKAVVASAQVGLGAWFARTYLGWQAAREVRNEPVGVGELAFLAAAATALVAALAGAVTAVSWTLARLTAFAGGGGGPGT